MYACKTHRNFRWLKASIAILLCFGLTFCASSSDSSKNKTDTSKDAATSDNDTDGFPIEDTTVTKFDNSICNAVGGAIIFATNNHLTAKESEKETYLVDGLKKWTEEVLTLYKMESQKTALEKPGQPCLQITSVLKAIFEGLSKEDVKSFSSYEEFAIWMINGLIDYTLREMDVYTGVDYSILRKKPKFPYTGQEITVPLLRRSDYAWRFPSSLIVNPFYDGSFSDMLPPMTKIFKVGPHDITTFSFEDTIKLLKESLDVDEVTNFEILKTGDEKFSNVSVRSKKTDPEVVPITSTVLEEGLVYIKVHIVSEKSKDSVLSNLNYEIEQIKKPKGLILDFRGNPGGATLYAAKMASFFLPEDTPVVLSERVGYDAKTEKKEESFDLKVNDFESNLKKPAWDKFDKILVLIDRTSASSSEIITAALTFNGVAISFGEQTNGKGISTLSRNFTNLLLPLRIVSGRLFARPTDSYKTVMPSDYSTESTWVNWQAKGLTPMIEQIDPVMQYLQDFEDKRDNKNQEFSMKDLERFNHKIIQSDISKFADDVVFNAPTSLDTLNRFKHLQTLRAYAQGLNTPSCAKDAVPGNAAFDESKECIFDKGVSVMKKWIELDQVPNT